MRLLGLFDWWNRTRNDERSQVYMNCTIRVEALSLMFFRTISKTATNKQKSTYTMSAKDPETLRTEVTLEKKALVAEITSDDGDDENVDKAVSVWHDAQDTVGLAVPMFLSMLSWVGMKTTDSALLGHLSADALAAAALSDLVRSTVSVSARFRVRYALPSIDFFRNTQY
jgi:hypothetical protein